MNSLGNYPGFHMNRGTPAAKPTVSVEAQIPSAFVRRPKGTTG